MMVLWWWAWAWAQALVDGVVTKNPIGDFLFGRTNRKTRPVKSSGLHVSQILKFSLLGYASNGFVRDIPLKTVINS